MKKVIISLIAALTAVSCVQAQKLVIKGSDTLGAKLVPMLKEAYVAKNPGIVSIIDGTANIGMSSRRATAPESSAAGAKGVKLAPTVVAYDGIGVIVNGDNPVKKLTRRQVEQIFAGDISDWSAVGGQPGKISIYTRNTSSGTYKDFKDLAMSKRDYAGSSQKMAGNEQIAAEVAKNKNGIGYVGLAYLHDPGIAVVAIDGVMPSNETVLNRKYAYARPTFYYTNGEPTGEAAKFIEFSLSDEGRQIVEKVGFVPPAK
jgi:phosphate transport system substrate-binding protein